MLDNLYKKMDILLNFLTKMEGWVAHILAEVAD